MSDHDRAVRDWIIAVGVLYVVVVGLLTVAIASPAPLVDVTTVSPPLSLPTVSWGRSGGSTDHAGTVAQCK